VEAGVPDGHARVLLDGLVLVLAESDAEPDDAVRLQLLVEVAGVATHVADQVQHSRPNLGVPVRHQPLNVLVGVDHVDGFVDLLGMARNLGEQVAGLNSGIGDLLVSLEELKSNEERHAAGLNELPNE